MCDFCSHSCDCRVGRCRKRGNGKGRSCQKCHHYVHQEGDVTDVDEEP